MYDVLKEHLRHLFVVLVSFLACIAASFCTISYMVGSHYSFFSLAHALAPLSGVWSLLSIAAVFCAQISLSVAVKTIGFMSIMYHIPTLCASAYWINGTTRFISGVMIPLVCMGLFIAHPIGNSAFLYSFYWLIPVIITVFSSRFFFLQALSATFIAHAVGSVLWLYMHPGMINTMWLSLIPVVFIERLLFAGSMTAVYMVIVQVKEIFYSKKSIFYLCQKGCA